MKSYGQQAIEAALMVLLMLFVIGGLDWLWNWFWRLEWLR